MSHLIKKLTLISLLLFSGLIQASIEQLENSNDLQIKTWINPDSDLVKGQQILLQIEISTTQKWNGPLDIGHVEMEDAIILQREKFSVNSTRNEKGKSWLVQLWTLVIYPQRIGEFTLPNFLINMGLVDEEGYVSRGDARAKGLSFKVNKNAAVEENIEWIASPQFSIEDDFDKPLEKLLPGDAFLRTVVFSAQDLPAMMLPKMDRNNIAGISLYSQPVELIDKANRGDYWGIRTERLTYVVQESGELYIPEQVFYWWDTDTNSLNEIRLPEYRVQVNRASLASLFTWPLFLGLSMGVLVLFGLIVLFRVNRLHVIAHWLEIKEKVGARLNLPQKGLEKRFKLACARGELEQALALLYQGLDTYDEDFSGVLRDYLVEFKNLELQQKFESVLNSLYAARDAQCLDAKTVDAEMLEVAQGIISEIKRHKTAERRWFKSVGLKLN